MVEDIGFGFSASRVCGVCGVLGFTLRPDPCQGRLKLCLWALFYRAVGLGIRGVRV